MGAVPCADADECRETAEIPQLVAYDGPQNAAHTDHCTPFCTCQCCQTHITQIDFFNLAELYHFENTLPAKNNLLVEGIAHRVWDPPRLSSC